MVKDVDDYYKIPERIQAVTKESIVDAATAMFSQGVGGLGLYGSCTPSLAAKLYEQISPLWQHRK